MSLGSSDPSRWICKWCGLRHPVARFIADHQEKCPKRPADRPAEQEEE